MKKNDNDWIIIAGTIIGVLLLLIFMLYCIGACCFFDIIYWISGLDP